MFRPARPVAAVVTDVEGTTSSIDFVHKLLFPYARETLPTFIASHRDNPEVARWLDLVVAETGLPASGEGVVEVLQGWIDVDRKHTALKALQGMIWREAFEADQFRSHIYPDAVFQLRQWHAQGIPLYVYSSGSIEAQRLYFRHTEAGDLSDLFQGHFDTTSGPKREPASYRQIATAIGCEPAGLLFLSDIEAELDAAAEAGWQCVQIVREDTIASTRHPTVTRLDEIELAAAAR
jgi:enolase-phosphatase E1